MRARTPASRGSAGRATDREVVVVAAVLVAGSDDQTFVSGQGLHEAAGVRWIERMQLFGVVHR